MGSATVVCIAPSEIAASYPIGPNPIWTRLLETSTREVFEAMLGETAAPAIYGEDDMPRATDFTALVGLSGGLCGTLALRCHAAAAYRMGSQMLGDSDY